MGREEIAIEVEGIGKKFTKRFAGYSRLMSKLGRILKNPFSTYRKGIETHSENWTLKNISFTLNKGEILGVVGHNGAGKSNLFKILARITHPTEGKAAVHGSLIAMLEVNDGFHPELTGRENIYVTGAMYGLSNADIKTILADISELSGTEQYLEAPVKHYSSGMRLKLAFAIAIMVKPDILILDEVLAVSDQAFRLRSIEILKRNSQEGNTLLIVSHDRKILQELCTKVLWLNEGEIVAFDATDKVLPDYLESMKHENEAI